MNVLYRVFHFCNKSASYSNPVGAGYTTHYDLTMVLSGKLLYIVENKPLLLEEGDVMLLPPGTHRHREALDEPVHFVSFNFFFDEQIDLPMCMKGAVTGEIRGLFKVFTPRYLSAEHTGKEKAGNVVGYILADLADTYERSTLNAHVQKAMEYIDNHITEPLSLEDVAAMLHLTREYTAALFKRETGMTVTQYINNRKLSRASDLIREEGNDLAEIAKSLGYKNYTYFSAIFKKHFGVSPSQFRK